MNDLNELIAKIKTHAATYARSTSKHRFVVIFFIIGVAISFALLKTRSFIDIPRNEERYSEEVLQINYKEIDQDILAEFKSVQQDTSVEVNPNFDPDRSNPFSE